MTDAGTNNNKKNEMTKIKYLLFGLPVSI